VGVISINYVLDYEQGKREVNMQVGKWRNFFPIFPEQTNKWFSVSTVVGILTHVVHLFAWVSWIRKTVDIIPVVTYAYSLSKTTFIKCLDSLELWPVITFLIRECWVLGKFKMMVFVIQNKISEQISEVR
jgi:hypothetical protein